MQIFIELFRSRYLGIECRMWQKKSNYIINVWKKLIEGDGKIGILTQVTLEMSGVCKTKGKRNCISTLDDKVVSCQGIH